MQNKLLFSFVILLVLLLLWWFMDKKPESHIYLFYANWCPACVAFKPTWDELKKYYGNKVNFIDIEDTEKERSKDMQTKLGISVSGFPTIVMVNKDKTTVYNGDRSKETMIKEIDSFIKN